MKRLVLLVVLLIAAPAHAAPSRIAFDFRDRIWTMDASGADRRPVARGFVPSFSPDGTRISFLRDGGLWIADADGSGAHRLVRGHIGPGAWSPDGTRIAFSTFGAAGEDLVTTIGVVRTDGHHRRTLARTRGRRLSYLIYPTWEPGGARIDYTRISAPDTYAIRSVGLDGGDDRLFLRDAGGGDWTPDGSRFAFSDYSTRHGESCGSDECFLNAEVAVLDGSTRRRLTDTLADESGPSWSADGTRLTYSSARNVPYFDFANAEIYAVAPDGSCLSRLTNSAWSADRPDWGSGDVPALCGDQAPTPLLRPTPKRRRDRMWLGAEFRNALLSHVDGPLLAYDDCSAVEPVDCLPPLYLSTLASCAPHRHEINRLKTGHLVGDRVAVLGRGGVGLVLVGSALVSVDFESSSRAGRAEAVDAVAAGLHRISGVPAGPAVLPPGERRLLPLRLRRHVGTCD